MTARAAILLCASMFGSDLATAQQATQDGQTAFNNSCRTCHTVKAGDHRQGPSLAGVFGRKAGAGDGYAYSDSLKQSDLTWDEANLDAFIEDPLSLVPGTTMQPYAGIRDAAQRKAIVDFLKTAK